MVQAGLLFLSSKSMFTARQYPSEDSCVFSGFVKVLSELKTYSYTYILVKIPDVLNKSFPLSFHLYSLGMLNFIFVLF